MTPTHFEFRFGPERRGDGRSRPRFHRQSRSPSTIDGEPIQITGQIDRIDVATVGGKTVFNVIDYKSGRRAAFKRDQLETGQQLQLPIYVEAAQALVFKGNATPLQAGYWSMGTGFDAKGALADEINDDRPNRRLARHANHRPQPYPRVHPQHPPRRFPASTAATTKCTSTCDYHMTCRVAQARSLKKTQWPDAANSN